MDEVLTSAKALAVATAVVALAAEVFSPWFSSLVRKWRGSDRVARHVFLLAFIVATLYGGAKNGTITFPRTDPDTWYFTDNGSAVSNNLVHVKILKNPVVPLTANIFLDALQVDYTNDSDWAAHSFNAYSNTLDMSGLDFNVPYAAATNFNWIGYTDWTPAPTTHTNGVAYIVWQIGVGKLTNDLAMTRTGVYTNTVRLAPNPAITNLPTVSLTLTSGADNEE